ncbi:patatin-like phospholipase family protein [Brevundimonas sp. FT23028]|uniref:patatin-like phospholipase family protein n=1 Tax=Brevundimonas sp. FT23028 TaxID=3393748 RepID=UPI003B58A480
MARRSGLQGWRRLGAVLMLASGLSACGTLSRIDPLPVRELDASVSPTRDPRIRPGDQVRSHEVIALFTRRLARHEGTGAVLALSGGGANGAFGAGVLVGWSEAGDRPSFDIVTGISTGALTAPFAFLGPEWDDALRAAYTGGEASSILSPRALAGLVHPSLYSAGPLRRLVDQNVTPELLRAIAAEHAKGRRLLVVTTNLDTQESVVWDMGQLASQGDEQALLLFREVLVASASIPGVFPPVMISGLQGDQIVEEMHVDGGVNMPFLGVPEDILAAGERVPGADRASLYVLINGQTGRTPGVVRGSLPAILTRTYESMSKASTRTHLAANAAFAARNGASLHVASIPADADASALNFEHDSMVRVFEMGRTRALAQEAWVTPDAELAAQPPVVALEGPQTPDGN